MIISASRRTDIPALYAEWFMNRIRAGFCTVPNPFNPEQVSRVSLRPEDVDVIVFWTRRPRPLLPHLDELDRRGYRTYFQVTLLDNPRLIDPGAPPLETSLQTIRELATRVGPSRVIWRYDPIVFSTLTGAAFHRRTFERIAKALEGRTRRCVVSLADMYRKTTRRMKALAAQGVEIDYSVASAPEFEELMRAMARIAAECGIEVVSCAEEVDLQPYGIRPGKCVDDDLIRSVFGIEVAPQKDPAQRAACGCVVSKDIGMYDSCTMGCAYCYATSSFERARAHRVAHDPQSPSLLG
jgi:DNA repair photolyase